LVEYSEEATSVFRHRSSVKKRNKPTGINADTYKIQKHLPNPTMNLKILLPYKVFADIKDVKQVVMETSEGSYGLLPQRLDCVADLVPGILTYETDSIHYVAVDEGVMIKAGLEVLVSVRNAVGGADLGKLGELVKSEFTKQDQLETQARTVVAKLERGFIYSFDKFRDH